jgi:hypothetical protein
MNDHLPILQQMLDAPDDRARADILLRVPDMVLSEHREHFDLFCFAARFEVGNAFIALRVASLLAVRDGSGQLSANLDTRLTSIRAALAQFSAGGHA